MATSESTTRVCPSCSAPVRKNRIYCSVRCAHVPFVKAVPAKACPICGLLFVRKARDRDSAVCCSRRCGWIYLPRVFKAKRLERLEHKRTEFAKFLLWLPIIVQRHVLEGIERSRSSSREYQRRKRARPAKAIICGSCGKTFDSQGGTARGKSYNRRFCSKPCAKRHQRRTHGKRHPARARLRGLPYDYSITSLKVFVRDRWTCQLCQRAAPRRLMGRLEARSPELDHIVPLSATNSPGHVWANVQCACRECNGRKSSKPLGQTRLF